MSFDIMDIVSEENIRDFVSSDKAETKGVLLAQIIESINHAYGDAQSLTERTRKLFGIGKTTKFSITRQEYDKLDNWLNVNLDVLMDENDGDGNEMRFVVLFKPYNLIVAFVGYYSSYDISEFQSAYIAKPVQVTYTEYRPV